MTRQAVQFEDTWWFDVSAAAQTLQVKADLLHAMIADGKLRGHEADGRTYILKSAVLRMKRENATLRAATRANKAKLNHAPAPRMRPHAAREHQDVLPMSSGRSGQGWLGQKPRT